MSYTVWMSGRRLVRISAKELQRCMPLCITESVLYQYPSKTKERKKKGSMIYARIS